MTNENPIVPAGSERRDAVREKAQQVKARQARAKVLRRGGIAVAVVAGVSAIAFAVTSVVAPSLNRPTLSPDNLDADGIAVSESDDLSALVAGSVSAEAPLETTPPQDGHVTTSAVSIRVYVDYLSEGSAQFEETNAAQIAEWVGEGAADLAYHPVALLTSNSNGTKYSLRAAAAVACVSTYAPDATLAFNHSLLIEQPAMDSDGYTDAELAAMADTAGAGGSDEVADCIEGEDFLTWANDTTQRALAEPLPGTDGVELTGAPMVLVNGRPYAGTLDDPAEFAQFVLTVSSEAYYATASPTPSPTATEEPSAEPTEDPAPSETPAE